MAINFPTSLDTLTNPASNNTLDSPSHSGQHSDVNDAVEALEAKVGADSSAVTTSHDYKLSGVSDGDYAASIGGTETLTNKTLTTPKINDTSANHQYVFASSELTADRTVTLPLLTGNDEFVFKDHTQTLTNKTLVSPVITTSFDGWVALGAATYEASDDPTYTISFASDMTGILSAGMRIKVTDSTVQYFIITGVGAYSAGKTIITLYGGTDYDLSGGALTNPYYSVQKIPQGFPLDPAKWSQVLVPLGGGNQTAPTTNTWYNLGSNSLVIPIGCWKVSYSAYPIGQKNSATDVNIEVTLSTANNSESDTTMTRVASISGAAGNINIGASLYADRFLTLTTKTTYHLNIRTTTETATILYMATDGYIKAVCAYL